MKHTKGIRRGRRNKNALKSITILYQNIRGLKSKFLSLQAIIQEQNPSIVCLVETFLTDPKSIQENETEEDDKEEDVMETLTIEGYIIVRKDRKNQYGGGCLIAYQERIKSLITEIESEETSLEALWVSIGNNAGKVHLGVLYLPGESSPIKTRKRAYDELQEQVEECNGREIILIGDFNAKLGITDQKETSSGKLLQNFILSNTMEVMNISDKCKGKWTRTEGAKESIIDYVITTDTELITSIEIDEERNFSPFHLKKEKEYTRRVYSDHNVMKITLNWKRAADVRNERIKRKVMTKKGHERFQTLMNENRFQDTINPTGSVKKEYTNWASKVWKLYQSQMTQVKIQNRCKVDRLLQKKIKALKKMKRQAPIEQRKHIMARIRLLEEHIIEEMKLKHRSKISEVIAAIKRTGKTDLEPFWNYVKHSKVHEQHRNMVIKNKKGNKLENKEDILKEFENHYQELLQIKKAVTEEEIEIEKNIETSIKALEQVTSNSEAITSKEEIVEVVKKLKKHKARDKQEWQNEVLIYGGEPVITALHILFRMIETQQSIPEEWSDIWIKSIFKNPRVKQVDKTRGLFMTNVISKVYEKVILRRNEDRVSTSQYQAGGKKGQSSLDHTMTILEIANKNSYLNKATYVTFIDMEKCFDKLWLQSGIVELWKSGMNPHDAQIIYNMNKEATITINTPVGMTNPIHVTNCVKQGTIYGPQVCSKEIEQVNAVHKKAVTIYSPRIEIETLSYVDDISHPGNKDSAEVSLENVRALEIKKKAMVNHEKSKYIIISKKTTKHPPLTTALANGKTLIREPQYNHLGTILHENGRCRNNIDRRIMLANSARAKVVLMSSPNTVGNFSFSIRLKLLNIVILTVMTYNLEAWAIITKEEVEVLEKSQYQIMRTLFNLPSNITYNGLLFEVGQWRVKDLIFYKRMMLLHNILHSSPFRIIRRIILDQDSHPFPNCWLETLKNEAKERGYIIMIEAIQQRPKVSFKKEIKKHIEKLVIKELKQENSTKMRTTLKTEYGGKKYIEDGNLTSSEIAEVIKIRLHMIELNENFRKDERPCQFCEEHKESTEHVLLECEKIEFIRKDIIRNKNIEFEDSSTENVKDLLMIYKRLKKILVL